MYIKFIFNFLLVILLATIIDGEAVYKEIMKELSAQINTMESELEIRPGLAAILVGNDLASRTYVGMKKKDCEKLGIYSEAIWFVDKDREITPKERKIFTEINMLDKITKEPILDEIKKFNEDENIHGILVQLPLPEDINKYEILDAINPLKDVDGIGSYSIACLSRGLDWYRPCTPAGIIYLLNHYGIEPKGKHVVVVGRSDIVGKPLKEMLLSKEHNATVTVCHTGTCDISYHTKQADILIAAMGNPEYIKADMVKKDAVVIDVGVNRVDDLGSIKGYKLVGDIDFDEVSQKASYITPVPGGVGPMTRAMLMRNTVDAASKKYTNPGV